jgi:hypothetical protein
MAASAAPIERNGASWVPVAPAAGPLLATNTPNAGLIQQASSSGSGPFAACLQPGGGGGGGGSGAGGAVGSVADGGAVLPDAAGVPGSEPAGASTTQCKSGKLHTAASTIDNCELKRRETDVTANSGVRLGTRVKSPFVHRHKPHGANAPSRKCRPCRPGYTRVAKKNRGA